MTEPRLDHIQQLRRNLDSGTICEAEFINGFLLNVLETTLDTVSVCAAAVPQRLHTEVRGYLREFAARDYFDDRHAYLNDRRTVDERSQHYRATRPHYKEVTRELLAIFDSADI